METAKPPTTRTMPLLLLWLLLCGVTIGSALPKRELQMVEMMQNILGVDTSNLSGRSQRSNPMLFAASVPCDDSLSEDTNESMSLFDEDLDESEECGGYGRPCLGEAQAPSALEPCPRPMLPMQHPCFVRVVLMRTPLKRHDPCKNFTLAMTPRPTTKTTKSTPTTTTMSRSPSTTQKPKCKKCQLRMFSHSSGMKSLAIRNNSTSTSPATTTTELETTPNTTMSEAETTTEDTTTTVESSTTTITTPATTTEELLPTMEMETTTTVAPSSTTVVLSHRNHLKSLRGRRRKQQRGRTASVPDTPKIKLDGAMQPSDTIPVFLTTEAAELRSRPMSITMRTEAPPTSTEVDSTGDCNEAPADEETAEENDESKTKEEADKETEASEDCEDAENQDTNLCPQFSGPEEAANMRLMPPGRRFRKPLKNYVEPILYEGQFVKPRQRIGMLPPQRRDYYVSNKQIMPRPRPKFREPVPHSIYVNNIVRGLKCSDEAGALNHAVQARRYLAMRKASLPPRVWPGRRHGPDCGPGTQNPRQSQHRGRGNPHYGQLGSAEDSDSFGNESDEYYDDDDRPDGLAWPRDHPLHPSSPTADPCQSELSRERERDRQRQREREREREREHERNRDNEHLMEYPQRVPTRFFT